MGKNGKISNLADSVKAVGDMKYKDLDVNLKKKKQFSFQNIIQNKVIKKKKSNNKQ